MNKDQLIRYFEYFSNPDPACDGIEKFLSKNGVDEVFEKLENENNLKLNKVRLNQLLMLSSLSNITFGFFQYYWLELQNEHPYNLQNLQFGFSKHNDNNEESLIEVGGFEKDKIASFFENNDKSSQMVSQIAHFRWGLLRIYTDALLYFGNINIGFKELGKKSYDELVEFFKLKSFDLDEIQKRGEFYEPKLFDKENRYLISEAVCKNLNGNDATQTALYKRLIERLEEAQSKGHQKVKIGALLDKEKKFSLTKNADLNASKKQNVDRSLQLELSLEDDVTTATIINKEVSSKEDIDAIIKPLYKHFKESREIALDNTKLYLSVINDLDIYVATSMRSKDDFMKMAEVCDEIFHKSDVKDLRLRYFDPTVSAAEGHDDKGLIECLMVKCAKALLYTSGDKDSYGKDAEAAMALSSGKPVIFYCPDKLRYNVSKNIHPLSKLIDFNTGVANGAFIAESIQEVNTLLKRTFINDHHYMLTKTESKIESSVFSDENTPTSENKISKVQFKLKDTLTTSTIRVQTSDLFLSKSFWNYYSRYIKDKSYKK